MSATRHWKLGALGTATAGALIAFAANPAVADQGGVSFWLPGMFGSLAATPLQPGISLATIYYHTSVGAGGNVAASRQAQAGRFNPAVNVNLNAELDANADLGVVLPTYVFEDRIFGGQLAVGMAAIGGHSKASIDGTLTTAIGNFSVTRQGTISDAASGFADLFPQASLRWNSGVHNVMTYVMGNIPIGTYDSTRLANLGLGHAAVDWGLGYTYFNPIKGNEFSVVAGLTYNFKNPDSDYRNGVNFHVDFGTAKFLSKQLFVGMVGYAYQQLTADSGQLAILGDFKSRVFGIGPQLGYLFPAANGMQGYLNLKGYYEFGAENRPEGWNTWLTLAFSPAEKPKSITGK